MSVPVTSAASESKLRIRVSHHAHQTQEEFCEPCQDVSAGPSGRIRILDPLVPQTYTLFENENGRFIRLHVLPGMTGWIRHGGSRKAESAAYQQWGMLTDGPTRRWLLSSRRFQGHLFIGNYQLDFGYDARSTKFDGTNLTRLRVALLVQHQVLSELVVREPRTVMLGRKQDLAAPLDHVPTQFTFVERTRGGYFLRFLSHWSGQLRVGTDKSLALHSYPLRQSLGMDTWQIKLSEDMRVRVQVGTHVYLINFVQPASTIAVPRP